MDLADKCNLVNAAGETQPAKAHILQAGERQMRLF
jgi:hypothetical protein